MAETAEAGGAGSSRTGPAVAGVALEVMSEVLEVPAPRHPLTVGLAIPKGDRLEWAVQKLVEVGVDSILLLSTDRSVVRWDQAKATRNLQRLALVARSAAMQSRQVRIPDLRGPLRVARVAADATSGAGPASGSGPAPGLGLAEPGGAALDRGTHTVLVGPEGGWSPDELAVGLPAVGLSEGVLRTETAAVVAGTLLATLRDGLLSGVGRDGPPKAAWSAGLPRATRSEGLPADARPDGPRGGAG